MTDLELPTLGRENCCPSGPGIPQPARIRPIARRNRLIAVESGRFDKHRTLPHSEGCEQPLDNLSDVMIRRIFLERPNHWIVSPERREALSHRDRQLRLFHHARRTGNKLMQIRVRMAAINVSLTVHSRVELTATKSDSFEVDHCVH